MLKPKTDQKVLILGNKPWMTKTTIKFLESIITKESKVLETGAGGSTIWFAERVRKVISFEHKKKWFNLVKERLIEKKLLDKVQLYYSPQYPNKGIPKLTEQYDLILIDGRGRVKSIETTYHYLKPGGYLVLDDSERMRYDSAIKLLNQLGWEKIMLRDTEIATAWRRPK